MKKQIQFFLKLIFVTLIGFTAGMFGCQGSDFEQLEPTIETKKKDNAENIKTQDASTQIEFFSEEGLSRIKKYLDYSSKAQDGASRIGNVANLLNLFYDWKHDPKTTKTYLKGGETDPLGKLLKILALKRFPHEADEGLLEIFQDKALLKEFIQYFTSESFLSKEKFLDLSKGITENNLEVIQKNIDEIYLNFMKHFGQFYHLESQWTPDSKDKKKFKPQKSGFSERVEETLIEQKGVSIEIKKGGNVSVTPTIEPSPLRTGVNEFITALIREYYDLREIKPVQKKKFH